jgi:hypothetical protein
MFAKSGAGLPRGVGTRSPEQVAAAVVRAVERDQGEVDVAPIGLRLGALVGGVSPTVSEAVQRWFGAERVAETIVRGQRGKG